MADPSVKINLGGHRDTVTSLAFGPKNQFATSSEDSCVMLWCPLSQERTLKFVGHAGATTDVDFSKDGRILASSSSDGTVKLWSPAARTSEEIEVCSAVNSVSFMEDSSKFVTCSTDKSIKLWDTNGGLISCYTGHDYSVTCVRATYDNDTLMSCSDDRTIRIWSTKTGEQMHVFETTNSTPVFVSIHPSAPYYVAVAMDSGSVRIYDIRKNKLQQHYTLHDSTTCVSWHPSGNYFLSSGKDGLLKIVDVLHGRPLYSLKGHDNVISTCKFSLDGQYFASGGVDKGIMVWNTNFVSVGGR